MSERTYTESELAAERAALLRQVAELCDASMSQILVEKGEFVRLKKKILAVPIDQSAFARVEAAVRNAERIKERKWTVETVENIRLEFGLPRILVELIKRRYADALQDRGREAEK